MARVSGSFHSASRLQGSSMSWHVSVPRSSLLLNEMDIWVVRAFWLGIMLL